MEAAKVLDTWEQVKSLVAQHDVETGIVTRVVRVTPQTAKMFLERNMQNRPLSNGRVLKYATDMKSGNWRNTHQGIAIDKDGVLVDGQHRLYAVIQADTPIFMNVSTGVDSDVFDVLDTGGNRSKSDVLSIAGVQPRIAKIVSAAVTYCANYDNRRPVTTRASSRFGNQNVMALKYSTANPRMFDSATFVSKMPRRDALLSQSLSCFFHFQISKVHDDADTFMNMLLTGDGVESGSAIFEMRKMMIANKIGNMRIVEEVLINRIIATYNLFHSGKTLKDPRCYIVKKGTEQQRIA